MDKDSILKSCIQGRGLVIILLIAVLFIAGSSLDIELFGTRVQQVLVMVAAVIAGVSKLREMLR